MVPTEGRVHPDRNRQDVCANREIKEKIARFRSWSLVTPQL